jgi:glycosyltransferase involved in cell wall biosynthesis
MRIAILGTRGVPASYGGFETFAEELGARLVALGHEVTVYGRSHHVPPGLREHRGIRLVVLPTLRHKYLDTVVHTGLSTFHALGRGYDIALFCNAANAVFTAWPRLSGTRTVLNVDGIERRRRKWNVLGRAWYALSELLASWLPNAVVTDARVIEAYYLSRYGVRTTFIPYGAGLEACAGTATLTRFGLTPRGYVLYVSRLEPENNAHAVIAGFEASALAMPLVVVGDAPYAREYIESLKRAAGPRVVFTGGVYGGGYAELQANAWVYVHATEVGGTHPALVEALGIGNCVLVNDVPENREAAGDAALYFRAGEPGTLTALLEEVAADPELAERMRTAAAARGRERYSWDVIAGKYAQLFEEVLGARGGIGRPA